MNFTAKCLVSVAILIARALTTSSALAGSPHGGKGNSMGRSMSRSTATSSMNHGGFAKSGQPSGGNSNSSAHSMGSGSFKQFSKGNMQQGNSHSTAHKQGDQSKFKSANAGSLSNKLNKHQQHCHKYPWPKPPVCHNSSHFGPGFGFGVGYCPPFSICAPYNNGPQVVTEVIVVETQPVIVQASAEAAPAEAASAVVPAAAPAAAEQDKKLPSVPAAATLTISGVGFGKDTGEVVLQVAELTMTVEVVTWENEKVTITVPRLGVVAPTKAELHLLTATGELAQTVPFELVAAK